MFLLALRKLTEASRKQNAEAKSRDITFLYIFEFGCSRAPIQRFWKSSNCHALAENHRHIPPSEVQSYIATIDGLGPRTQAKHRQLDYLDLITRHVRMLRFRCLHPHHYYCTMVRSSSQARPDKICHHNSTSKARQTIAGQKHSQCFELQAMSNSM